MKNALSLTLGPGQLALLLLLLLTGSTPAATLYVDAASTNPVPPYTNWLTAAAVIQDAVDASAADDEVVVTNGVYASGGRAVFGTMTNRVVVDRAITLRSVNGPEVTVIQGYRVPGTTNGNSAIRCVYLTNGAVLGGFTMTNGATHSAGDSIRERSGGGVWCESSFAVVTNCTLMGNSAYMYGGGAYSGSLNNCTLNGNWVRGGGGGAGRCILAGCTIMGNSAGSGGGVYTATLSNCVLLANSAVLSGGGAYSGLLNNCTLLDNSAQDGGGVSSATLNNCAIARNSASRYGGGVYAGSLNNCTITGNSTYAYDGGGHGGGAHSATLNNCIVFYNSASASPNHEGCTFNYSCTMPDPGSGTGNITTEPQLAGAFRLSADSPCCGAGHEAYATGVDMDGEPWFSPPAIGCDEYQVGSLTGPLTVAFGASWTNVAVGFALSLTGTINGRVAASVWDLGDGTILSNQPYASHAWRAAGDYPVVLRAYNESYPDGVSATGIIHVAAQAVYFVSAASASPMPPYGSWATAARTIQAAVDITLPGALVLVSNGVYASGGRAMFGTMTNRVAVDRPVIVRSVNGPGVTMIQGCQVPETNNGDGAVRCAYLTNSAVLDGFTLANGGTRAAGDELREQRGGGVWCEPTGTLVTNCTLTNNSAASAGGGACSGTLNNCTLAGNRASYGAGAEYSTLNNCILAGNLGLGGGGVGHATVNSSTFTSNSADFYGGGADSGRRGNSAPFPARAQTQPAGVSIPDGLNKV